MEDKEMIKIVNTMLRDIISSQAPSYNDREEVDGVCDIASYRFIPYQHTTNIDIFYNLREKLPDIKEWSGHRQRGGNRMFIDAGCGIGNVLVTAKATRLCDNWHGIEYFEKTYERAEKWLGKDWGDILRHPYGSKLEIFKDDILTFKNYSKYDIIYFYCPFSDYRLQVRFEEYLEDEMKVGAILIPMMKKGAAIMDDHRFKQINQMGGPVWIKVKNGERQVSTDIGIGGLTCKKRRKLYEDKYVDYYKELAQR